jgi:AmmeMemoRadiSam system protein B
LAGQWYPANPQRLAEQVERYLDDARLPEISGEVLGVMAPHAGLRYSGPVAAYAFAAVRGLAPDIVAVVSPMHDYMPRPLLTSAHEAYATPLGNVPVDRAALLRLDDFLREELDFGLSAIQRDHEHSLEIELPFLQRALAAPFALLPIMVRDPGLETARGLGNALARLAQEMLAQDNKRMLLVASTDLSHFYPRPVADALDAEMLRQVSAFNPAGVIETEEQGKGFACGRGALAAVMFAAKQLGADRAMVLQHATSGDVTGDDAQVVGYGAAAFIRTPQ